MLPAAQEEFLGRKKQTFLTNVQTTANQLEAQINSWLAGLPK